MLAQDTMDFDLVDLAKNIGPGAAVQRFLGPQTAGIGQDPTGTAIALIGGLAVVVLAVNGLAGWALVRNSKHDPSKFWATASGILGVVTLVGTGIGVLGLVGVGIAAASER